MILSYLSAFPCWGKLHFHPWIGRDIIWRTDRPSPPDLIFLDTLGLTGRWKLNVQLRIKYPRLIDNWEVNHHKNYCQKVRSMLGMSVSFYSESLIIISESPSFILWRLSDNNILSAYNTIDPITLIQGSWHYRVDGIPSFYLIKNTR